MKRTANELVTGRGKKRATPVTIMLSISMRNSHPVIIVLPIYL
jgi:hypothetical protein